MFGLLGVLITDVIQPEVNRITQMIPLPVVHWMCVIFMAFIVADTIITVLGIIDLADNLAKFSETVQAYAEKAGDSLQWGKDISETNSATRCKTRSRIGRTPRRRFLPICRPLPHLS